MPFKSKAQENFMWSQHPDIAKRWAKEYPKQKDMREKKDYDRNTKNAMKGRP